MGSITFVFPDSRRVTVTPVLTSLNLLAHAQLEELFIGSQCGGHGRCGADRIRIPDQATRRLLSPITEIERLRLRDEELRSGIRLGCQCFPDREDLTLTVEVLQTMSNG